MKAWYGKYKSIFEFLKDEMEKSKENLTNGEEEPSICMDELAEIKNLRKSA